MFYRLIISSVFCCFGLMAQDFPIEGQLFPIDEENLLEVIKRSVKEPSEEQLQKWQHALEEKIRRPSPVPGLQEAKTYRSWYFDPTKTFEEEVTDLEGNVIVYAGRSINPLETMTLHTGLLFFDGDLDEHIEWAKFQEGEFKWVLVKGSPLTLEEEEERNVYFDQGGMYCKMFGIKNIPCRITQEGRKLLVEEIPIQRRKG